MLTSSDYMIRALQLALQGQGFVEPNPMVGCVVVRDDQIVGEGWHQRHGGPHAEVHALADAGDKAAGADLYVTLEPCCHHGKTPPCADAVIAAGIRRVFIGMSDPFPQVDGGGISKLQDAGIEVVTSVNEADAKDLCAPYLKLVQQGRPWIIAKWAMTLDGKIATHTGHSQWISSAESRAIVHQIRSRVDGVLVGSGTAKADDPLLNARTTENDGSADRIATRIVLDTQATLSLDSKLVTTANEFPVLVAVHIDAPSERISKLQQHGCEVFICQGDSYQQRLASLLDELGSRQMTNILVEGGGKVLGSLLDGQHVDEVHTFIAPKIVGGADATSPVQGIGAATMPESWELNRMNIESVGGDIYVSGRVRR